MGADGFITDPTKPLEFPCRCHHCSSKMYPGEIPSETHNHEDEGGPDGRYTGQSAYPISFDDRTDRKHAANFDNWIER